MENELVTTKPKKVVVQVDPDVVKPMLVLMMKFFKCAKRTILGDFVMVGRRRSVAQSITVELEGFTQDDFQTLKSLVNSVGTEMAIALGEYERNSELKELSDGQAEPVLHDSKGR